MTTAMITTIGLFLVAVVASVLDIALFKSRRTLKALTERFRPVIDADAERARVLGQLAKEAASARQALAQHVEERQREIAALLGQREAHAAACRETEVRLRALCENRVSASWYCSLRPQPPPPYITTEGDDNVRAATS
jgi:hypothetical protein